ncbi:MAG: hypothetical protein O3C45_06065 [Bacteroidetes bacterium]|nr:hypothetical protein [Bacteroidota bacterium]
MKRFFSLAFASLFFAGFAFGQANVSTQQVSIRVQDIAVIAVQGDVNMTINAATAGQAPDAATASATWALTTNGKNMKISAELDQDMPDGLTLFAEMGAPNGAKSKGKTALSGKGKDLLSNITKVNASGLSLSYEAVATVEADVENVVRTVTYTITKN